MRVIYETNYRIHKRRTMHAKTTKFESILVFNVIISLVFNHRRLDKLRIANMEAIHKWKIHKNMTKFTAEMICGSMGTRDANM